MNSTSNSRLSLRTERLTELTTEELVAVAGGQVSITCLTGNETYRCPTPTTGITYACITPSPAITTV